MNGSPTRVAIYARVSTNDQDPRLQLDELGQYAAARGLNEGLPLLLRSQSAHKNFSGRDKLIGEKFFELG